MWGFMTCDNYLLSQVIKHPLRRPLRRRKGRSGRLQQRAPRESSSPAGSRIPRRGGGGLSASGKRAAARPVSARGACAASLHQARSENRSTAVM